jgi:staphylococcal nuclease domain-containing protein 1
LLTFVKDRLPVHGVVEGVLDGSTVRVLLVPSFYSVVVRLAGVQAPIWTRGGGEHKGGGGEEGSVRTAQPFAEQAKYLTEFCLLGRDVSVHVGGVNKDETFYGAVLFGGKNVAEELLKNGLARFVQWSCAEGDASKFLALEGQAQSKGVGLHKGSASQVKSKDFQATVVDVRSGSRLTVETDDFTSFDVFFSSVIAPKLNPKNPKEDEPCGFEAREFLRKKLIGKKVRVAFDYEKAARDGEDQPPRKFYSVYLQGKHVPLLMVEQGLGQVRRVGTEVVCCSYLFRAQVITHRREEPRSREYSALMAAEEGAKKVGRGIWDTKHETKRVIDQSNMRGAQAKQYLKFVQPQGGLTAIVEFVMNPVRLKLYIPSLSSFISFTLAAVRSPWADDEFGDEACAWARRHFHQRKLEIDVQTVDKGGNFLGDAFFRKMNVALTLLEEGWASVSRGSERHPSIALYGKAEAAAQAAKKGIWRNYVPPKEPELEGMASAGPVASVSAPAASGSAASAAAPAAAAEGASETCQLLVTEVTDGSCFYCQRVSDEHQKRLDALMSELQKANAGAGLPPPTRKWARNDVACVRYAEDGLWYRVRLMEGPADRRFKVGFVFPVFCVLF